MTLIVTIIIVQIISVGFYHFYSYFFDDYVSETKIVSFCFDSANRCELVSDDSNIKNLTDYVYDNKIIEDVVYNIETKTNRYLSVTDIKNSITVDSKEGYLLLRIKSDDSYLAHAIYDNLITEVFAEANNNQIRYTVVDNSLYEIVYLSFVQQTGILIGAFIGFIIIFSSTKSSSNFNLIGGIKLAKNKMKQNIIITLVTIAVFTLVGSGIYFGHKQLFKSYQIETKYTFVCNDPGTCDFDDVNELYNALKSYTSKNSTVTSIIESVSTKSQVHLSSKDIEESFELKLSNDVIVLIVTNKDTLTATYIYDTLTNNIFNDIEIQEGIELRQLDNKFSETPDYSTYLLTSISLGSIVGLLLISSELSLKKGKKESPKTTVK